MRVRRRYFLLECPWHRPAGGQVLEWSAAWVCPQRHAWWQNILLRTVLAFRVTGPFRRA